MSSSTAVVPPRAQTETNWLQLAQLSLTLAVPALVVYAIVATFFTTISEGDFRYTADYWYTGVGLPITLAGVGIALAVHKLQHGADGRLGTVGVWINTLALTELFAQLLASVLTSAEVRWGPAYPVSVLLSFIGVALLAAGSWRTGLLPKWMLGLWPLIWVLGSIGAVVGPTPLLLAAYFIAFGVTLTRRVQGSPAR